MSNAIGDVTIDFKKRAKNFEGHSRWATDRNINKIPLKYLLQIHPAGDLLDAGGGTGYLSYFLSQHIKFNSISLVDVSKDMLAEAERKAYGVNIFNSSIEDFCNTSQKKFDTILIRQVLHYVNHVDEVISLLAAVLKKTGLIYIGQFLENNDECKKWHNQLMQEISRNRRRTLSCNELLEYVRKNNLEIIQNDVTLFEENLLDFYDKRIIDSFSFEELKNKMISLVNKNIEEKMSIRITADNVYFTVKFHHFLLKNNK